MFLTRLADKYNIKLLQREVRVNSQARLLWTDLQNFTVRLIHQNHRASLDLWIFAVYNKFPELEAYCLQDYYFVKADIMKILKEKEKGVTYFLDHVKIPKATMNDIVAEIAAASNWK